MSAAYWKTDISCLLALALKNLFQHVLYFNTLDKTGIATLLVDEDDIKRDITTAQQQMMSAAHWPSDVRCLLAE